LPYTPLFRSDGSFLKGFAERFSRRRLVGKVAEKEAARMAMRIDRSMALKKRDAGRPLLRAELHPQLRKLRRVANGRLRILGVAACGFRAERRNSGYGHQASESVTTRQPWGTCPRIS
jgi:hypothetical protein